MFRLSISISISIAGLVTARICHDHFEKVIIVEPETWLATEEGWRPEREPKTKSRARVSQYQSPHGDITTTSEVRLSNT